MKRIQFLASVIQTPPRPFSAPLRRQHFTCKSTLRHSAPSESMATVSGDDGPTAPAPPAVNDATSTARTPEEKSLPKLTPFEFRQYNRMAEHMQYFHDNFRATWKVLYGACESQKRPKNMSIRQFISTGQQFCRKKHVYIFRRNYTLTASA